MQMQNKKLTCEEAKNRIKELESEIQILKENKVEVSKAKELYLKIFKDFPALIWRSGLDKLCDYFNNTWLSFTGRTMEQEIEKYGGIFDDYLTKPTDENLLIDKVNKFLKITG